MTPTRRSVLAAGIAGIVGASALSSTAHAGGPDTGTIALPGEGCDTDPHTRKRELRAMWIASVSSIDWPSRPGLTAAAQQAELTAYLDLAVAERHNAVVLQVRPTADAFWPSAVEPWSHWLTGTQGEDPGWDPLGWAVAEAHARGLELHAWFNPYRVSQGTDRSTLSADHPGSVHPDWVVEYGGKLYYDPGLPQVRDLSVRAILDAVEKYPIDAVHFDDYFYPYPVAGQDFGDAETYAEHGGGMELADWRRANVDGFIREVRAGIQRLRPTTQLGVSPFAIWRNASTDPEGSDTQAGAQTYDDLYADTRRWVREEWLDYVTPQIYWSRTLEIADYDKVAEWWLEQVEGTRVHLYTGEASYKVGDNADTAWDDPEELSSHLQVHAENPRLEGAMYFSAKVVRANPLDAHGIIGRTWYSRPALTPASPWLAPAGSAAPRSVPVVHLRSSASSGGHARLSWNGSRSGAVQYVIYRVPGTAVASCDLADARHIAAIVPDEGSQQSWTDPEPAGEDVRYVVTAVDLVRRESAGRVAR